MNTTFLTATHGDTKMRKQRNGAILPLIAFLMLSLILALGLMVELNWLSASRFEAQSASDLATRSALARLYDNTTNLDQLAIDEAKDLGVEIYQRNFPSLPIAAADLDFGRLDGTTEDFEVLANENQFVDITASRVEHQQRFTPLLGTLLAQSDIDLPVFTVAETGRFELYLALDASRSMNRTADGATEFPPGGTTIDEPPLPGSRWFTLLEEVENFLDLVEQTDTGTGASASLIGLTTFGGGLNPFMTPSPLDADFGRFEFAAAPLAVNNPLIIQRLEDYSQLPALGVGTSIYDGVQLATQQLQTTQTPRQQFIVLFSDGFQAVNGQRPNELEAAQDAANLGITIYTIAFATDNQNLADIAKITGGESFSANNQQELQDAFTAIARSLSTRVAQ